MRLNFSHATVKEANLRIKNLRECKGRHDLLLQRDENLRAVLLDTQGPEIRTGNLAGDDTGKKTIKLEIGSKVTNTKFQTIQNKSKLNNTFKRSFSEQIARAELKGQLPMRFGSVTPN